MVKRLTPARGLDLPRQSPVHSHARSINLKGPPVNARGPIG